ncbi:MAG: CDP-glycerol glycerophosphotransferase family protein [Candidatus Limnocylindria bacterium]
MPEETGGASEKGGGPHLGEPARIELVSLHWERIQAVLRIRSTMGALCPEEIRLARSAPEPAEPMPPTRSEHHDDELVLRFNVMLGPGQHPLASGRWLLCLRTGAPLRMVNRDLIDSLVHQRTFRYRGGRYRVTPVHDETTGAPAFDIRNRRSASRPQPWHRRLRRWFRRAVRPRQRIFELLLGLFRANVRRNGRRILFTSDSHAGLAGNLAVVHDRMVERGLDRTYELKTIFKPSVAAKRGWRDRVRLPRLLGRADVILIDDYQPIIYRLKPDPDVRIIQLWHASGAFKTVGYSRVGKPGGPSPYARTHKNYTHATVSGQHDVPYYAEAFGLPEERLIPTGIPRMDRFFDPEQLARGRDLAQRAFPAIQGRTTILFAPTFRGKGPRSAYYDFELIDWAALHEVCTAKDAVVIVKMHPFVRQQVPIPARFGDRIIDGSPALIDVNDLLFAVDLLITDYSSIVFEFSTLLRPMLFFAYDLEDYVATRDFYVPFEEFVPGRIVGSFDELMNAIRHDAYQVEKVPSFASRHFDRLDGHATDRVIDELILKR